MTESTEEKAWILFSEQGLSWSQVKYHLTEEDGIDEITARQIIDSLKQKAECIEIKEEEERQLKKQERELQKIIKNEEGNTAVQRADKKIMIGIIIIGVAIALLLLCPALHMRIKLIMFFIGISLIVTGLRHRDIIYEHQNKKN